MTRANHSSTSSCALMSWRESTCRRPDEEPTSTAGRTPVPTASSPIRNPNLPQSVLTFGLFSRSRKSTTTTGPLAIPKALGMPSIALLFVAAALVGAGSAAASRAPTSAERAAIARLVLRDLRLPAAASGCVTVKVRVSTANDNWAYGAAVFKRTARCIRFASNGFDLLSWQRQRGWRIDYRGSVPPRCRSIVPAAVTRDLLGRCQR